MANFCLIPQAVDNFKKGLKSREIDPAKLAEMDSKARRDFLEKYVGKDNAVQVNALFESKLLLKNQKAGMISWAKKVSGITPEIRRDLLAKIEKLDKVLNPAEEKAFLQDLANTKLGTEVTAAEAKQIFDLSTQVTEAKKKMKEDFTWENKEDGIQYGAAREALEQTVANLKGKNKPSDFVKPTSIESVRQDIKATVRFVAQNTRAFVASFDNSFWGNQGLRAALDPRFTKSWATNFARSFIDIAKVLTAKNATQKGDAILSATRAEIYSRKNSLNGRYEMSTPETSKLSIGVLEEEVPTSLPSKIPVLGRGFKAAEVAYEAGAMRLRADIADKVYAMAEKMDVNMNDKFEVGSRNVVVNSLTGRGKINAPNLINEAAFSIKFLKSQLDFLTAPIGGIDKISPSAKKLAAQNTLYVLASTAVILGISKALDPDSTDFDSRSPKFGKIEKDGITLINLMPGYGSIVTLISRILTQSTKNRAGIVKPLGEGYGTPNGMDIFWDFTENKASPIAAIIRDLVRQKNFEGDKPTIGSISKDAINSITLETTKKILDDKSGDTLLKAIAIGLGFVGSGAGTTAFPTNWKNSTTEELAQFKKSVGEKKYNEANDKFNSLYDAWYQKTMVKESYKELSDKAKQKLITDAKEKIKDKILKEYQFTYKKQKADKTEETKIKELLPN